MTAIAALCTSEGFIVAADGRVVNPEDTGIVLGDERQKIFAINDRDRILACAFTGFGGIGDFEIVQQAHYQSAELSDFDFRGLYDYSKEFCIGLSSRFKRIKAQGVLDKLPTRAWMPQFQAWQIVTVVIAGYVHGVSSWAVIRFMHHEQADIDFNIYPIPSTPGYRVLLGSGRLQELLYPTDRDTPSDLRLRRFVRPSGKDSMDQSVEFAKAWIEAHSDPVALQEDYEGCRVVGGHIHIAKVTPNAFRWRIPPIKNPPSLAGE